MKDFFICLLRSTPMQLDPGTETVFFRQRRSLVRVYSYPSGLASGMMCHWNLPRSPPPRPLLSFLVNRSARQISFYVDNLLK